MSVTGIAIVSIVALLILVLAGIHIGFSLALISFLGIYCITGNLRPTLSMVSGVAFEGIREYSFAVVPLFVLMGCFMSRSGVARNLFDAFNYVLKRMPGGMGIATVISNAVFAAVTGVSVASAAVFSRICIPEMSRYKYAKKFALGAVAGSSVLGMLIPPSILMIVYGMLSETSIGKLFMAGFIPGLVLAGIYSIGIIVMSMVKPEQVGLVRGADGRLRPAGKSAGEEKQEAFLPVFIRALPIFIIVVVVLGGIWGGIFTPTEASAVGAFSTFLLSICMGMRWADLKASLLECTGTTASIFFLLLTAQMYSRLLAMSGIAVYLSNLVLQSGLGQLWILLLIFLVLIILGCILDSTSILLLTVPLILPIASVFQWNLVWLGIVLIVVVEMGLLTPPFGMVVFAMKATLDDDEVKVEDIFSGSLPYLAMMVFEVGLLVCIPSMATWLPSL